MEKIICNSLEETAEFGRNFAKQLKGGDIVFLYGDLGAGKTTLTKSIAKGLGIEQDITSPTFTLMNMYYFYHGQLCHFDLYRLENVDELFELGFEEYFYSNTSICLIEWPQILKDIIDVPYKVLIINKIGENQREIIIGDSNENIIH